MRYGVCAGYGTLPQIAVQNLRNAGHEVVVIAFTEEVTTDLAPFATTLHTISIGQAGKIIKTLAREKVDEVIFAGKVDKSLLYKNFKFDLTALALLAKLKDRKDDTIMLAVVDALQKEGLTVGKQTDALTTLLHPAQVFSKKKPSKEQLADVEFGFGIAREMGRLDIGQTVVVKDRAVMAVEAIEGTDRCVERGCQLAREGAVVTKVAKPSQDLRFDVPTVGVDTLKKLADNNGVVLAVEAEKTFIVDLDTCVRFADQHGIVFMTY